MSVNHIFSDLETKFFDKVYLYFDEKSQIEGSFEVYIQNLLASPEFHKLVVLDYTVASVRNAIREQIRQATFIGAGYYKVCNNRSPFVEKKMLLGYRDMQQEEIDKIKETVHVWTDEQYKEAMGLKLFTDPNSRTHGLYIVKLNCGAVLWLLTIKELHERHIIPKGEYKGHDYEYVLYDPVEEFVIRFDPFCFLIANFNQIRSIRFDGRRPRTRCLSDYLEI